MQNEKSKNHDSLTTSELILPAEQTDALADGTRPASHHVNLLLCAILK